MSDQNFTSGEILDGKYRLEKLLGQGGMGAVYQATHLGTKRTVAVKVIHQQFSAQAEFIERFRREAEAAGQLRHPNVVDVTDFGFAETSGRKIAYLVMEYLDGGSLAEVLREEGKLPPVWVADILEQVCSAVDEAHALGLIHRDLKPDNIWLEPNWRGGYTVKVLDFGLVKFDFHNSPSDDLSPIDPAHPSEISKIPTAENSPTQIQLSPITEAATKVKENTEPATKIFSAGELSKGSNSSDNDLLTADNTATIKKSPVPKAAGISRPGDAVSELTLVGSIMGTPLYMSPEQCRGDRLDGESDIYNLGIIAYEMLAGETPFTGTPAELLKLHQNAAPPPIREKNSKVPKKIANLVMSALNKNPQLRPASAAGFAAALRTGTEGSGYLIRSAVSLYSEHFPIFFKTALIAYIPVILFVAAMNVSDMLGLSNLTIILSLLCGLLVANVAAYFTVSAAAVPIVVQSILAPLRPINLKTSFSTLWKRRWVFILLSLIVTGLIFFGTLLFVVPGILLAVFFVLYPPVAMIENLSVWETLKRARQLMKRTWGTALLITILQFALPILVWYLSVSINFVFKLHDDYSPQEFSFGLSTSGRTAVFQLLNIFVVPLTSIMTALLYIKTRRAGGETLKETVQNFDNVEVSQSKWQKRLSGNKL